MSSIIMGVKVQARQAQAGGVQDILTQYGDCIRARLGLHDGDGTGLLMLQLCGGETKAEQLLAALNAVDGVSAKLMVL